jgi:hypothetical protein
MFRLERAFRSSLDVTHTELNTHSTADGHSLHYGIRRAPSISAIDAMTRARFGIVRAMCKRTLGRGNSERG